MPSSRLSSRREVQRHPWRCFCFVMLSQVCLFLFCFALLPYKSFASIVRLLVLALYLICKKKMHVSAYLNISCAFSQVFFLFGYFVIFQFVCFLLILLSFLRCVFSKERQSQCAIGWEEICGGIRRSGGIDVEKIINHRGSNVIYCKGGSGKKGEEQITNLWQN